MKQNIKKMKQNINEIKRMQVLAGIKLNELEINNPLIPQDIEDKLIEAGIYFEDGILGGIGSGGGGYYDSTSDKISGYHLDSFNEDEFNKWYDEFSKDSFNSFTYESEFGEENEDGIDYDIIRQIGKGIYSVGELGYGGGQAEIDENGDLTLYAIPTLSNEDEFLPIFSLYINGKIKEMDKNELMSKLKENIKNPGSWSII